MDPIPIVETAYPEDDIEEAVSGLGRRGPRILALGDGAGCVEPRARQIHRGIEHRRGYPPGGSRGGSDRACPRHRNFPTTLLTLERSSALEAAMARFEGGRLVVSVVDLAVIKCPVAPLEFSFLADW